MRSQRSVAGPLTAGALALVVLAGCANAEPGVAAYVGGTKITDTQVTDAVDGVSQTLGQGQQVSTPAVVNALIHGAIAERVAAQHNIVITDGERDSLIKGSNLAALVNVPAAKVVAYDVADQEIVAKKLGAEPYLAELQQQRVTLNPRYGVLDPKQQLIVADRSGSLADPASTPAPQAPQ